MDAFWEVIRVWIISFVLQKVGYCAEIVITLPNTFRNDEFSEYRLVYFPPIGSPPSNTTIPAGEIGNEIKISNVNPGTKYVFDLFYSNSTINNSPLVKASITTVPDPPGYLNVTVENGTAAVIDFDKPLKGNWDSFKLKLFQLLSPTETKSLRNVSLLELTPFIVTDLIPGGSYQVQLSTVYSNKESPLTLMNLVNFTTPPNMPVNCIVWFRNQTTLKILWHPPIEPSIHSYYKVKIHSGELPGSTVYVDKGDPPGPAQVTFKDLIPGRPYNISIQAVSNGMLSLPTTALYWTEPLPPEKLQVNPGSVTTSSFTVTWEPPDDKTEFDKYQISINVSHPIPIPPVMKNKTEPRMMTFSERLKPGHIYKVSIMTVSGKASSEKAFTNVTLRPLPVKNLKAEVLVPSGHVRLTWKPDNSSYQTGYEISYTEVYNGSILNGDTNFMMSPKNEYTLNSLLPGRNYSISVKAASNLTLSNPVTTFLATKPSAPVIEELKPIEFGLNISWKSDVNSRQEKYQIRCKNDTDPYSINQYTEYNNILVEDLYPGSRYNIKIFAISHGLWSDPHDYFQAVYPNPPSDLKRINATSDSVYLSWKSPIDSLFSEFSIRFKTEEDIKWKKEIVKTPHAELRDLIPGEHYTIQLNSVSFGVESARPIYLNHTVYPSPVSNIAPLIDSTNVTVDFPRPDGRIEKYVVDWLPLDGNVKKDLKSMTVTDVGRKGDRVRILVENLMPGVKYEFSIKTSSHQLFSNFTPFITRTVPLIVSDIVVVSNVAAPNIMSIHYTQTPPSVSYFDKYRFKISPSDEVQEKFTSDSKWTVTFQDLIPGKVYNISVWTVSDNTLSQPLYRQERLYPEHIANLKATMIKDTLVTLEWVRPKGEITTYEINYMNVDKVMQNITTEESCTIRNLKPYNNYTFTVTAVSGSDPRSMKRSLPVTATFLTLESHPERVVDFHPVTVKPREIEFAWSLPEREWNGVPLKYTVTYGEVDSLDENRSDFSPTDSKGFIKNLIPGKTYIFKIQAMTKVGYGPEKTWKELMPIFAPPKPNDHSVPTEVSCTSSTIQVRFRSSYFSDDNGPIIAYTIIVAEDDKKNTSGIEMPSWRDVQSYSIWPPYQVLEPYYPFRNSTVEDFMIGIEDCDKKPKGYCNGPLKGGTVYRVKIRAFTTMSTFSDTLYSFPIQTDRNKLPIILWTTLPSLFIVCLVIAGVIIYRRYRLGLVLLKVPPPPRGNVNLTLDNIIETSKPIKMDKFPSYYQIMSADSDFRFSEQFEQLKLVGKEQPITFAHLPCNRPKNRFTNILPYDHSRFKLQPVDDEEGSDYINANYVPGYNSPREYIVTQGPLPSTKDDFWRMCWESNSRAIVMLTRCIEKGREKCDHYWPEDTKVVYYGDISVTVLNERHLPHWCITELMVQRGDTKKTVKHFHFTTWPDFGVPNPPTILLEFVRTFRKKMSNEPRPIIVHCSAGVGRSGTFVAIDRILQSIDHSADSIDIFGVVYQMRKERVLMVQTEQQYICIHQCILAAIQGLENQPQRDLVHQNQGYEDDEGIGISST